MKKAIKKKAKKAVKTREKAILPPKIEPETDYVKKTKIRVVGIGGGGGNIVSEIASKIKGVSFFAANTDSQALKSLHRKVGTFQFGESFTHGLGAGMDPEKAALAAQTAKEKIKKLLEGQDLVILVATLGGGTGSGAAPVFAKISQDLGNLTLGIFTLPFKFEGEKKLEIANQSLERVKSKVNAFSVVPNERIFQIVEKTTALVKAFSAINKIVSQSLGGLIETVFEPGLINIDFADLRTIFSSTGKLAYLNCVQVPKSEGSAKETAEKVLGSLLYPYSIRGARGVLFNISGGQDLTLAEVSQISQTISDLVNKEAKIIFGISQGKNYRNLIKAAVLAVGCQIRTQRESVKPKLTLAKKPKLIKKETAKIQPKKEAKKEIKEKEADEDGIEEKKIEVRKNALQLKAEAEEEEKEIEAKEKFWEIPSFLRKDNSQTK